MKTLIGVNTLSNIDSQVYSNHCQFWFRTARRFPEDDFALFTPVRSSIDRMRNIAAKVAMESDFDYLMFIDDDVFIPTDAFSKLVVENKDIIAGHVVVRGYPFEPMVFKYDEGKLTFFSDIDKYRGVVDCAAVGFSCCLIKVSLLKKMTPPFFVTGPHNTEDVYFCVKAKMEVPDVTIAVNLAVECGHLGIPPVYTPSNKEIFKELEKPKEEVVKGRRDHSEEYFDKCLQSF